MRLLKVDFPSMFFVALTAVLILGAAVALRFNQSKYLVESLSPGILSSAFSEEQAETFQDESVIAMQQVATQSRSGKRTLDIVTFALWFIFGIVAYYLCYGFYAAFIHPFSEDATEAHYVHGNAQSLIKKRLLWFMSIGFTGLMIFGAYSVFKSIVLTYYMASIYSPGLINGLMLLASVAITSLLISFIRLGCRVVIRAY